MLITQLDVASKRIVDVIYHDEENKDAGLLEYQVFYENLTGQHLEATTVEEARLACVDVVNNGHTKIKRHLSIVEKEAYIRPPWLKEDGTPTAEHVQGPEPIGPDPRDFNEHLPNQELGPVGKARLIFEKMWGSPRKDIMEACTKAGIKLSTASTQYQHFKKAKETEANDTRNPATGMPQLAPGVQVGSAPAQHGATADEGTPQTPEETPPKA
jgi:hypothetical protein